MEELSVILAPFVGLLWLFKRLIFGWHTQYYRMYRRLRHSKAKGWTEFEYLHPFGSLSWWNFDENEYEESQRIEKAEMAEIMADSDKLAAFERAHKWRKPLAIVLAIISNLVMILGILSVYIGIPAIIIIVWLSDMRG